MKNILRAFSYLLPYWYLQVLAVLSSLIVACIGLFYPWAVKLLVDDVLIQRNAQLLLPLIGIYGIVVVLMPIFETLKSGLFTYAGECVIQDIRGRLFHHLRQLSMSYFHEERTGKVMSVFTTDVPATGELYTSTLSNFVTTTLAILAILVVLIKLNWQMMLMGLPLTPLFLWAPIVFARSIQNASRRVQDKLAEISDKLQESITATNVVLAFTRERWDINRLKRLFSHLPRIRTKHTLLQSLSGQMSYMGTLICLMFFYWLGGRKVLADEMPVGTMIAFAMYMSQMLGQTQTYVGLYNRIQTAMGAAERVFEFMDTQPGIVDSKDAISPSSVLGRVEFDHVCFSYQSGNRVLSDICLSVEPGEMIAIVGKSGAGKSTLVNLIARFYETSSGRILIDNHNIRQVKLESLRKHIAFVFQETFLFATSVRENIALGRMDADFDDITAAAKNANADGFIRQLPDGYNTYVGERGVKLSVGQKQRVAIARALLRNPRILILDEATSSLDSESEQAIQDALFRLMEGRTSFVIAHRLSTIKKSDRILVLDDGKIVEIGTHIELLERGGLYHKLYTMQFESNESD